MSYRECRRCRRYWRDRGQVVTAAAAAYGGDVDDLVDRYRTAVHDLAHSLIDPSSPVLVVRWSTTTPDQDGPEDAVGDGGDTA